jgi:RNA polymerase sigma factor (sigma-70 family)
LSLDKENIDFLIALCKKNNSAAQKELYNRFYTAMYRTAYNFVKDPMLAEDIMQEGFITAFEKLDQYKGGGAFPGWLKQIVVRKSIQYLREQPQMQYIDEIHPTSEETLEEKELQPIATHHLHEALEQLPMKQQNILKLYYLEGFDYEEIGTVLNISYANCRTSLSRAREQLKLRLTALKESN